MLPALNFVDQSLAQRWLRRQCDHCLRELQWTANIAGKAAAVFGNLGHLTKICTDARTSMPQAFDNGKTEAFDQRRINSEGAVAIQFAELIITHFAMPGYPRVLRNRAFHKGHDELCIFVAIPHQMKLRGF